MQIRRTAVAVAMITAVAVPLVAAGVVASAQPSSSSVGVVSVAKKSAKKPAGMPARKVAFSATGTVTAVDAAKSTVTVAVKGGTKDVRGRSVTVSVPSSVRILLNGKRIQVSALAAGNKITVVGTRVDAAYTATKVQATGKARVVRSPGPSVTPSPTTSPTDMPSAEPSESAEPTESESEHSEHM